MLTALTLNEYRVDGDNPVTVVEVPKGTRKVRLCPGIHHVTSYQARPLMPDAVHDRSTVVEDTPSTCKSTDAACDNPIDTTNINNMKAGNNARLRADIG